MDSTYNDNMSIDGKNVHFTYCHFLLLILNCILYFK